MSTSGRDGDGYGWVLCKLLLRRQARAHGRVKEAIASVEAMRLRREAGRRCKERPSHSEHGAGARVGRAEAALADTE